MHYEEKVNLKTTANPISHPQTLNTQTLKGSLQKQH